MSKRVCLKFSIVVPDDTDPAYVVEIANRAHGARTSPPSTTPLLWGDWLVYDAELAGPVDEKGNRSRTCCDAEGDHIVHHVRDPKGDEAAHG